jgi:hypothetical protein
MELDIVCHIIHSIPVGDPDLGIHCVMLAHILLTVGLYQTFPAKILPEDGRNSSRQNQNNIIVHRN